MKALVYNGPGERAWESAPDPSILAPTDAIVRIDTSTICGSDLHILKGDVPEVDARNDPRPRGGRDRRRGRRGGDDDRRRRPRARLVHHLVRPLPLLPGGPLRSLRRRRRLDLRPPDRRPPGGVRPRPVRGHLRLQGAGGPERRAGAVPRRHPADGLRGRRPERPRRAGGHGRGRRCGPDRACRDHDREAAHPGPDHRDRPRRRPARQGARVRRRRDDQQRRRGRRREGHGADRRARCGRRHRGGRRAGHVRAVHGVDPAGRTRRERRRARKVRDAPPREALDP